MHDSRVLKRKLHSLRKALAHSYGVRIAPHLHEVLVVMRRSASFKEQLYDGIAYCHKNLQAVSASAILQPLRQMTPLGHWSCKAHGEIADGIGMDETGALPGRIYRASGNARTRLHEFQPGG